MERFHYSLQGHAVTGTSKEVKHKLGKMSERLYNFLNEYNHGNNGCGISCSGLTPVIEDGKMPRGYIKAKMTVKVKGDKSAVNNLLLPAIKGLGYDVTPI
ncbi:MAG: hypothetical protein V1900_04435 [Candidatus Aenigmatarchaeota archaeon]